MLSLVEINPVVLENKIFKFRQCILANYLPLEKGGTLHLKKRESHLPKNALFQIWLKLAHCFWRGRILSFFKIGRLIWRKSSS